MTSAAPTQPLITAREDDGVFEAVAIMQQKAVRRLAVLGADGALRGIVTADDVLRVLSAELGNLARRSSTPSAGTASSRRRR